MLYFGTVFGYKQSIKQKIIYVVATSKQEAADSLCDHNIPMSVGEANKYMLESRNQQAQKFVDENPDVVVFVKVKEFEKVEKTS